MYQNNRAQYSTYHIRGTGIPCNDKRAHAPGREPICLSSRCKNYQFSNVRFKAMASMFLSMKNRKYMYSKSKVTNFLIIRYRERLFFNYSFDLKGISN